IVSDKYISDFKLKLSNLIHDRGYSAETLTEGNELLSRLNSVAAPALILMDVMMPGDDGIQIIEKIRRAGIQIPVIMISGIGLVKSVVEAMKVGATDFLVKPFDEMAFETAIENALQKNVQHAVPQSVQAALHGDGFVTAN